MIKKNGNVVKKEILDEIKSNIQYEMKQLEEIFKQEPIYLHDWEENKRIGVISDLSVK